MRSYRNKRDNFFMEPPLIIYKMCSYAHIVKPLNRGPRVSCQTDTLIVVFEKNFHFKSLIQLGIVNVPIDSPPRRHFESWAASRHE